MHRVNKLKKLLHIRFYLFNYKEYRKKMKKDEVFNATFRCGERQ